MNRRKRWRGEGSLQNDIGGSNKPRRPQKAPRWEAAGRGEDDDKKAQLPNTASTSGRDSAVLIVSDLPAGCTVLELKTRFEMFGSVSRVKIEQNLGFGYITFRLRDSAELAIMTSRNPLYPISIGNKQVHVSWANDPLPQWRAGVGLSMQKDGSTSKLLRAEVPLSRHGKTSRRLGDDKLTSRKDPNSIHKGREIIAYDDLL
ncbi:uncharacterized protein At1g27050 [Nymphaea colorata]|nr:uncharacterized protein At1g27050 [Nymphaea colorata]